MPQPSASPRLAALEIVQQSLQGQDLQAALSSGLANNRLNPGDAALCTRICYYYLRLKGRLEFILQSLCAKRLKHLPNRAIYCLGLGLFELLYLSRVPDYATVYWYVEYSKTNLPQGLTPMINAVLRKAAREKQQLLEPGFYKQDRPGHSLFLSRYYSCPQWLADFWLRNYGREKSELLLANSLDPPLVGLRINQTRPEAEQLLQLMLQENSLRQRLGYGMALEGAPGSVPELEKQGLLSRQSLASQQAILQLNPEQWRQPVWEACAGHGGKTALLLENNRQGLWASDISADKIKQVRQELLRLHLPQIPLFAADAAREPPLGQRPATVVLDAPCSGLGVLSRRPDIKWKLRKRDLGTLSRLQGRMLRSCLDILPSKGRIYYLTCTLNPEENQAQIRHLLSRADIAQYQEYPPDLESGLREYFYAAWLQKK